MLVVFSSVHGGAAGAAEEIQRACEADQEDPWQVVGSALATASTNCACVGVKGEPLGRCSHWTHPKGK